MDNIDATTPAGASDIDTETRAPRGLNVTAELNERPRLVLLAEAEGAGRRLLAWTLRVDGYVVDTVSSANELRKAELSQYDLLIASTELLDATRAGLLDGPLAAGLPVIVMSPSPSEACARHYGATTCVHRPIYVDELRGAVRACLADDELDGDISQPILAPPMALAADSPL